MRPPGKLDLKSSGILNQGIYDQGHGPNFFRKPEKMFRVSDAHATSVFNNSADLVPAVDKSTIGSPDLNLTLPKPTIFPGLA
jgi:hypothetical protein